MDASTALRLAQECFGDTSIDHVNVRSIARLWAGMGNIYRVDCPGPKETRSLIVKYVRPLLRMDRLSVGDRRKLDSYLVEANFYQDHVARLIRDHQVSLPHCYKVERLYEPNHPNHPPTILICMSALQDPTSRDGPLEEGVVTWLARFHAATWQADPGNLQAVGSYWHLDTRLEEWDRMSGRGWEGRLKRAARAIDERLRRDPLQCWVHGDAKDANILLQSDDHHHSKNTLVFCDFQYVGRGPPTRDLAYFFCSSEVQDQREQNRLLDLYFQELTGHLKQRGIRHLPTRQQLEESLELAYCDFCRFMAGWGYWGYDLSRQVQKTLDKLDGGEALKTEDDYRLAVEREFG